MGKFKDLTGQKFGRLTVIERAENIRNAKGVSKVMWKCRCDCGNDDLIVVYSGNLLTGNTTSCGCISLEKIKQYNLNNKKKNDYNLDGDYGIGYTSKGEEFYFDIEDYDNIKNYCWWKHHTGYIMADSFTNGKRKTIYLHKLVMKCPYSGRFQIVDHINGNKIDCRKNNLRYATAQQNNQNHKLNKNNKSGYSGVQWNRWHKVWDVCISIDGKRTYVGTSKDKNEAICMRKNAEKQYYGEWVRDSNADMVKQEEVHNG